MKKISILIFFILIYSLNAQVEHVPVVHPVYSFLLHAETRGFLPHFSLSSLPLQRQEIINALIKIEENKDKLNSTEFEILKRFETEFEIINRTNAVIFYSPSDTNQVLSGRFFGDDEKFFYHYKDSNAAVNISPLGSVDVIGSWSKEKPSHALMANLGVRFFGTIGTHFGYYLQTTNGALINGERAVALEDLRMRQNVKFADLKSDFDFSESHVRFQYDWFYTIIGRETRLLGAGINQRLFISANAPPFDAFSLGARFSNFEYRFTHGSLIAINNQKLQVGFNAEIPSKYVAIHRFALKPEWGEFAFWENIIYSKRSIDMAYLNPLSFFKSLEHALHDRDNSMMGGDLTLRPFNGMQVKGSYLLDDIKFDKIGTGYWSNKSAWNIGLLYALPGAIDFGLEYSRVEPFTFSHFDSLNSMTNDEMQFGSYLPPNSDETLLFAQWWWGNRYPLQLRLSYMRHGENIYDESGNIIENVGGDALHTLQTTGELPKVKFLDGNRKNTVKLEIETGWEIVRGFNLQGIYRLIAEDNNINHSFRIIFRFEDF